MFNADSSVMLILREKSTLPLIEIHLNSHFFPRYSFTAYLHNVNFVLIIKRDLSALQSLLQCINHFEVKKLKDLEQINKIFE